MSLVVGKLRRVEDSVLPNLQPYPKGYAPCSGNPAYFQGGITLQRYLLYEDGLGKIMPGFETAPADLECDASGDEIAAREVLE